MVVVNFKRCVEGDKAVDLARLCKKYGAIACPQLADLAVCVETGVECWIQKYEPQAVGHVGALLNHSDYPLTEEVLNAQCSMLKKFTKCICVNSLEEAIRVDRLRPDFIAFEPHELIGSREKSVSSEKPEEIRRIVLSTQRKVLIGAGVHSAKDVKIALEMGARGILVATDVVKAVDPEKELRELVEAFSTTPPAGFPS